MKKDYDLVIIGAGIHGAACAQAAAARNFSVLVLEQYQQPGLATSSASSKLIHGGLRYLETAQFSLVYECLRERRYLLANAPHLVSLEKFHIPVYSHTRRRPWQVFAGLLIYSLFSRKGFRIVAKKHWPELDGLKQQDLQAVFQYVDGKTDDRQLSCAVMASAQQMGAELISCAVFLSSVYEQGWHRIRFQSGRQQSVRARAIVNCAGPWVNQVLEKIHPRIKPLDMELVLGSHIVLDRSLAKGMYYLESPTDGRAVFVMPWKGKTLVGTTERAFHGDVNDISPPAEDIDYLLDIYRYYFGGHVDKSSIVDSFAGCRVLPADQHNPFEKSRETIIHQGPEKVLTIYGGKLTAHRATADKVMRQLAEFLPKRHIKADTRYLKLPVIW